MADDFDVDQMLESMLEAPYRKDDDAVAAVAEPRTSSSDHDSRRSDQEQHQNEENDDQASDRGSVSNSAQGGGGDVASDHGNGKENEKRRRNRRSRSRSEGMEVDERRSKDKERERERDKERSSRRDRDRSRSRDRKVDERSKKPLDKDREKKDRDRDRKRSPSRERRDRRRSRSPRDNKPRTSKDRKRSRERNNRRRSRSPGRRRRSMSPRPYRRGRTPPNGVRNRSPAEEITAEERDARTVFCMQLSQRIRARDLDEFFSSVGKVRDVRLITCNKTKRFKGIAYIEFKDPESVSLAMGLSGQRLLGIPISVQPTQAEKNRLANAPPVAAAKNPPTGPMRLYVGSLHFNITEDMLRGIFEPFGQIDNIQLIMDTETGRSKGYGFIAFHNADDAKKALEQLNGFELAGRPMKVGNVTERLDVNTNGGSLDNDEMDRTGIDLGATGRLQLMFKLAENAGLAVPQAAANALLATAPQPAPIIQQQVAPPIATQCFLLSNMFDPATETAENWATDIQDDVIEECNKNGGVLHVFVDTASPQGHVYVKCPSIATAVLTVNALHGRWFAGRVITAAYVPLINYHGLFPDALPAQILLMPTRKP